MKCKFIALILTATISSTFFSSIPAYAYSIQNNVDKTTFESSFNESSIELQNIDSNVKSYDSDTIIESYDTNYDIESYALGSGLWTLVKKFLKNNWQDIALGTFLIGFEKILDRGTELVQKLFDKNTGTSIDPTKVMISNNHSASVKNIKELQTLLNQHINANLTVDGIWGPKTRNAVITFQSQNGLTADGIVGYNTWCKLFEKPKN